MHTDNCSNYLPNKIRWKRTIQYKTVLDNKSQIYTSGKFSNYKKINKSKWNEKNHAMEDTIEWRTKTRGHKQYLKIINM